MAFDTSTWVSEVQRTKGVEQSALNVINTIHDRVQAGIDAALANGLTAEQLAPVQTAIDETKPVTDALAAAVAANP